MARLRFIFVLLPLIVMVGCASSPPAPPALIRPAAQIATSYYIGTPLSGPREGDAGQISFANALELHAKWFVLLHFNPGQLPLLASQARLVTASSGGAAVLPSGALTSQARFAWTDSNSIQALNATRQDTIGESRGALPIGTTVVFRAIDEAGLVDQTLNHPEPRFIEVSVGRLTQAANEGEKLQIGVTVEDDAPATPRSGVFQTETAILEHSLSLDPATVRVVIPYQFTGSNADAVAAVISISRTEDRDSAGVLAQCKTALTSPHPSGNLPPLWVLGLRRATDSLNDPSRRRAALVYLSSQSDAGICLDAASVCDDEMLRKISDMAHADAEAALDASDLDRFAWALDRSSIAAMQPLLSKATLPPELFTVLTLRMGEPGRHAAAVDDIMRQAKSRADLLNRLIAENFIYLEDSSPAARVRADDWLKSHNAAPAGFDPLATPKQRRIALDKALAAYSTTNPSQGAP